MISMILYKILLIYFLVTITIGWFTPYYETLLDIGIFMAMGLALISLPLFWSIPLILITLLLRYHLKDGIEYDGYISYRDRDRW